MTGIEAGTAPIVKIDIVICTYNRAANLDEALYALSAQHVGSDVIWSVLVIDNGSTDATAEVVEAHRFRRLLPHLRRVVESEQGLTPARRRGVQETTAPWIAFVDDDNLLDSGWVDAIAQTIRSHPEAGGISGRVVLDWEQPPPNFLKGLGSCFAEQELGEAAREIDDMVGAGMVLRRSALVECGWLQRPLLADRIGKRLVSGGDCEIVQRVLGAGFQLWFTPDAVLRHRISRSRTSWHYLLRVMYGLGGSEARVSVLVWRGDWRSWRRAAQWRSLKRLGRPFRQRQGLIRTLAWLCYGVGFARGVLACMTMVPTQRQALLGAAVRNR